MSPGAANSMHVYRIGACKQLHYKKKIKKCTPTQCQLPNSTAWDPAGLPAYSQRLLVLLCNKCHDAGGSPYHTPASGQSFSGSMPAVM